MKEKQFEKNKSKFKHLKNKKRIVMKLQEGKDFGYWAKITWNKIFKKWESIYFLIFCVFNQNEKKKPLDMLCISRFFKSMKEILKECFFIDFENNNF